MKKSRLVLIAALFITAVLNVPALSHHSMAVYDQTTLVAITGTVTGVEWRNPHSWITLSVTSTDGTTSNPRIEIAGPASLIKRGFTQDLLRMRAVVTFEAWFPKDAKHGSVPAGRMLTLADGRRFDVGDNWGNRADALVPGVNPTR
jgi:hypothetical protein